MDLNRPAWDAFVIEGLDNVSGVPKGSFGLFLRIHHAAIDGHSGHAVLRVLHDLSPIAPKPKKLSRKDYMPAPLPTTAQMLTRAYFHLIGKPGKIAKVVANAVPAVRRAKSLKREHPGEERSAPLTRFSAKATAHRVVILLNLDMESLRPVRLSVDGATLNDVIVSIISGAMRKYLQSKGELPEQSMTTGMPINIRTEADKDTPGNVVSLASLNMHSDIDDPLQRVHAIHASAIFTKAYHNAIGAHIMSDVAESIPAGITALGTRAASAAGLMDKLPVNTVVTNVPGPQVPFYMAGAKVVEFQCAGIVLDGLGLFHSVNSYCGKFAITVLADRHMMPDPEFYEQCLRDSYDEHIAAASNFKAKSTPKSKRQNRTLSAKVAKPTPKTASAKRVTAVKKTIAAKAAVKAKTAKPKPSATTVNTPTRRKMTKATQALSRKRSASGSRATAVV
jgi:WS/DGAT/MGAT family acyltransferase